MMDQGELRNRMKALQVEGSMGARDVQWIFNFSDFYVQFEAFLKGGNVKYDVNGLPKIEFPTDHSYPWANKEGTHKVMTFVRGLVNDITSLTKLREYDVGNISRECGLAFIQFLFVNSYRFELKPGAIRSLGVAFSSLLKATLSRSIGGFALGKSLSAEKRITTENISEEKRRFLP